ncbi:MAG: Uma2 family endonuclease [Planctomycetes bacterium]|nr:Uma2 family endonuclease [Planctomycetota bacterium]MCB9872514.1 Uma2 family endonuclease [Planctomycetota bacterium]MCB9888977.1 Uma2 family endonuclease [Planctomycetota bacterium]
MRGEGSGVRITYSDGEVELMSPSTDHEWIKKTIARLVEAWSEETGVDLTGYGSWTVKKQRLSMGLEPDECYVLGTEEKSRPDLAIEVVRTHGGLDKLQVYRALGVPEVWIWKDQRIDVFALRDTGYEQVAASEVLPDLDVTQVQRFVSHSNQTQAVREYRRSLRQD